MTTQRRVEAWELASLANASVTGLQATQMTPISDAKLPTTVRKRKKLSRQARTVQAGLM